MRKGEKTEEIGVNSMGKMVIERAGKDNSRDGTLLDDLGNAPEAHLWKWWKANNLISRRSMMERSEKLHPFI